jgi:hypothetical protein
MGASDEDRAMATAPSVSRWIEQLKQGDRQPAQPPWERYFIQLVRLARSWSPRTPTTRVASAEDVALDAFPSFCRRAEQDGFARLFDRDDLWQILVAIAFCKRCNQIQYEKRKRRTPDGGRVCVISALEQDDGEVRRCRRTCSAVSRSRRWWCRRPKRAGGCWLNLRTSNYARSPSGRWKASPMRRLRRSWTAVPTVERKLARIRCLWEKEFTP